MGGSSAAGFQPNEENAGFVDPNLRAGFKAGYRFTYAPVWDAKTHTNIGYTVHADPIPQPAEPPTWLERVFHSKKEPRHLFSDQSGVIRVEMGKEASVNSPPL